MESDLRELRDGDVCPGIYLIIGPLKEKRAFEYGSTSSLLRLKVVGRPVSGLLCLGGAWAY